MCGKRRSQCCRLYVNKYQIVQFIQHFEVIVRVESDHYPVICKVNCAFNESLRTNTITPASIA